MLRRREQPIKKSSQELALMREAGRMVAEVLATLERMLVPGVSTGDLNEAAGAKMGELGADRPSFLNYVVGGKAYPGNICASVDDEVVHGIPGRCRYRGRVIPDRVLRAGQLITVDCGVQFQGFHGDSAVTFAVEAASTQDRALMDTCRDALWAGIRAVRPGGRLSEVAGAIEALVSERRAGVRKRYGIVRDYVGHGIGRRLHEAPQVPNYVSRQLRRNDLVLEPGFVLAIEPMVCQGTHRTRVLRDGWTVVTRDGQRAAHYEHTVAVTEEGYEVLTRRGDGLATH